MAIVVAPDINVPGEISSVLDATEDLDKSF